MSHRNGLVNHVSKMNSPVRILPGAAYPGVRDNRSSLNTKTGYEKNEKSALNRPRPLIIFACSDSGNRCVEKKLSYRRQAVYPMMMI